MEHKKDKKHKKGKKAGFPRDASKGPKPYTIQGSNLELFGTDVEHKCKESAAAGEKQWQGTGQAVGLKIWRIEKFKVVPWPVEHYGEFYDGDSYIVFNTHGIAPHFQFDVHFWLGEHTTQDEAGTAAYKTVELDDFHHGAPVQHREVQGYESEMFVSYFPQGLHIMHGGVETGFRHVTPEQYKPRLFHVRGGFRDCRVWEVPLTRDSLNSGDAFVLDAGLKIFQWHGSSAAGPEKMKAGQFSRHLHSERSGRPQVIILEEPSGDPEFWQLLGGEGPIMTAEEGNSQDNAPAQATVKSLFRLSDKSGSLTFTEVAKGSLKKASLDTNDVFIVDACDRIWVWVGARSNTNEKRRAMGFAHKYLVDHNRKLQTGISKVPEGVATPGFDQCFDG